jgi:hypothetical protein
VHIFQVRRDLGSACGLHAVAQRADHTRDVGEHDLDRYGKRRLGDARRRIAASGENGEADQLPGRAEPAHHQQERIEEDVAVAPDRRLEQRLHIVELVVRKIADGRRQARGDHAQRVAHAQDGADLAHVLERLRGTDLRRDAARRLGVALAGGLDLAHALLGEILEGACDLYGVLPAIRREQQVDLIHIGLRLLRHQIACDPFPDRRQAGARDAAAMLALGRIVDQERLDRRKEQALRMIEARQLAAGVARVGAQFLEDHIRAGRIFAAQPRAFELGRQQGSRLGRQLTQVLTQFLVGHRFGHALTRTSLPFGRTSKRALRTR